MACCLILATLYFVGINDSLLAQDRTALRHQDLVSLPAETYNGFCFDGRFYSASPDLLMEATFSSATITSLLGDTMFYTIDEDIDYALRHPITGNIFFTTVNKRGFHTLYELVPREGKKPKAVKHKMDRLSVDNPTFSTDGNIIVFATTPESGYGGRDLFYSKLSRKGEWSAPHNMGKQINTVGDQARPNIYGDFLFYASRDTAANALWHIMAARLVQPAVPEGNPSHPVIGGCPAYKLPAPFNDEYNTYAIVFDTFNYRIFILSDRQGTMAIYLYDGLMPAVSVCGQVLNAEHKPLPLAEVSVFHNDMLLTRSRTDSQGQFRFILGEGNSYTLWISKNNYFGNTLEIDVRQTDNNHAISEVAHTVQLDNLDLGKPLYLYDVFGHDASVELSSHGKQQLQRFVRFLHENPQLGASIGVSSLMSNDGDLNTMVTEQRIESLRRYLSNVLPRNKMDIYSAPSGVNGNAKGAYNSRLAIYMQ
ncbi:MAG: carboxypeptidase regulatory-like domain-containing protein [Bacteroidales bacterium]|nr:carboxypeptidase regulatory-like domain-containing protein [Bacteroidales bacterium]